MNQNEKYMHASSFLSCPVKGEQKYHHSQHQSCMSFPLFLPSLLPLIPPLKLLPLRQRGQDQAFPHICVRVGIAIPRPGAARETGESRRIQEEEEGVHQGFVGHGCKGGGS